MTVRHIVGRADLYQGALAFSEFCDYLVNFGKVFKEVYYATDVATDAIFVVPIKTPDSAIRVWLSFRISGGSGGIYSFWEGTTYAPEATLKDKNRVNAAVSTTLIDTFTGEAAEPAVGTMLWKALLTPAGSPATYTGYSPVYESNVLEESKYLLAANTEYAIVVQGLAGVTVNTSVEVEIIEEVPRES